MGKTYIVQPSEIPGGRLPYPFFADEAGMVGRQDFWAGNPSRIVGFAARPVSGRVDLSWRDAVTDPARAIGMHLVTEDADESWDTHMNTVASVKEIRADSSEEG